MRLHARAPGYCTAGREGACAQIARQWQPAARTTCARMGGVLRLSKGRDAGVSDTGVRRASLHPVAQGRSPLPQLQGLSRFRTGVAPCRCVVPELLLYSSHEALRALHELKCFIHRLLYDVEAYVLGSIGVNQDMRAMAEASCLCWDFTHLLQTMHGRSIMKRSLTWSRDCSQFCGRACCHTVLSLGL